MAIQLATTILDFQQDKRFSSCPSAFLTVGTPENEYINRPFLAKNQTGHWSIKDGRIEKGDLMFLLLPFPGYPPALRRELFAGVLLKSYWVLIVMDVFTRRIIGFGVQAVAVDGPALCRLFNQAISGHPLPKRLSYDHDPLFEFQRWQANLRILGIESVRTVPYAPVSHPFLERLIGTIRREYLDRIFFWNEMDLEQKLEQFKIYYNQLRVHQSLEGATPEEKAGRATIQPLDLGNYRWQAHCHCLFDLPIAA
jgi:transposase InsO family protein